MHYTFVVIYIYIYDDKGVVRMLVKIKAII
jgi:hypothetical protein